MEVNLNMPPNSEAAKAERAEEEKRNAVPKPQLSGGAKPQNTGLWSNIVNTFLKGRNLEDVVTGVITRTLVPAIIDGLANAGKATIDGIFYPNGGAPQQDNRLGVGVNRTNYSYSSLSRPTNTTSQVGRVQVSGGRYTNDPSPNRYLTGFTNIRFASYSDAEAVARYMFQMTSEYDAITIADFYDACGDYAKDLPRTHVDSKWGWMRGTNFNPVRAAGAWIIDLPDPIAIN